MHCASASNPRLYIPLRVCPIFKSVLFSFLARAHLGVIVLGVLLNRISIRILMSCFLRSLAVFFLFATPLLPAQQADRGTGSATGDNSSVQPDSNSDSSRDASQTTPSS